jgi:hypothetical protein
MTTSDPLLTEAFVSAFRAAHEARLHAWELRSMLARKLETSENRDRTIVDPSEISAVFGFIHEAVKRWVELDGDDWQALVAAATGREADGPQRVPSKFACAFGHMLRELRASKGITSEELARRASMDIQRFDEIDGGLSEPNLVELFSISASLDTTPSEFIRRMESADIP